MSDLSKQTSDYLRELMELSTPPSSVLMDIPDLLQLCYEAEGHTDMGICADGDGIKLRGVIISQGREIANVDREARRYRLAWYSARRRARVERIAKDVTAGALVNVIADRERAKRWPPFRGRGNR